MMKFYKSNLTVFYLLCAFIFCYNHTKAQDVINLTKSTLSKSLGTKIEFFTDSNSVFNDTNIITCKNFTKGKISVPIFISPRYNIWSRFTLSNSTKDTNFFLAINYAYISDVWFYKLDKTNNLVLINHTGNATPYNTRMFDNINFVFPFSISSSEKQTYYIKVSSPHPTELPISINDNKGETANYFQQNFIIGIYLGIIISFFLYNAFLFFSTKDKNYLLYIVYLFFLGFAQITFTGWSFKYFWPSNPEFNFYAVIITTALTGVSGVAFGKSFLNASHFTPKLNKVLTVLIVFYCVSIVFILLKQSFISYQILNVNSVLVGIFLLITSIIILKKGYRPANFYLVAWSFFLLGLIVFPLTKYWYNTYK